MYLDKRYVTKGPEHIEFCGFFLIPTISLPYEP